MPDRTPLTRLSFELREELCHRLRDRQSWKQLNAWLNPLCHGPYKAQNFSQFKQSKRHYVAWLSEQRKLDERRDRADSLRRELAADGFSTVDHAMLSLVDSLADPDINPVKATSALAALKSAHTAGVRAELEKERVKLAKESANLNREKFQFQVAGQFLSWYADERARSIADSASSNTDKIQKLVTLMESLEA